MAQEIAEQSMAIPSDPSLPSAPDDRRPPPDFAFPALSRALSSSRLNARTAEFVPRPSMQLPASSPVPIRQGLAPIAHPVAHVSHQVPSGPTYFDPWPSSFGYVGGGFGENDLGHAGFELGPSSLHREGLSAEVIQKITNQMQPSFRNLTTFPTSVGVDQLSLLNRQILGAQLSLNIRPSSSVKASSQPSAATIKKASQVLAPSKVQSVMPMNISSQTSSANKHLSQMRPPQKVPSEPFESVRSKLRESLAASLVMVTDQQSKQQTVEKSPLADSSNSEVKLAAPIHETKDAKVVSPEKSIPGTSISDESAEKLENVGSPASHVFKENVNHNTVVTSSSREILQPMTISLEEEVPKDSSFVKDELLQGHGLCWASDYDVEPVSDLKVGGQKGHIVGNGQETVDREITAKNAEHLASRIEAELFRLFGGVNKKYKEKGRSLLFNLKDRSNPELRERVLSGVITPEKLCTMTTEELASKELSQWRMAKAEELAQMVVLPDSDVDLRRLVKKTHKGEVEVEQVESFPVEVELGSGIGSQVISKKSKSNLKSDEYNASESRAASRKSDSGDQDISNDIEILHEKTDLMQELMVDELKDPGLLPPIVSLDEFMQVLDSEPPFESLSVDSLQEVPSSGVQKLGSLEPEKVPASESVEHKQDTSSSRLVAKSESLQDGSPSKLASSQESMQLDMGPADGLSEEPATLSPVKVDLKCPTNDDMNLKSVSSDIQSNACAEAALTSDKIWEGLVQLNISSMATVNAFFRSGEKGFIQEWPNLLEIKGRVRLDAFERFLKELPLSRSRAIMIVEFCWKEGSAESGRLNLREISDSYIADERVGFAEAAPGVELYLCPSHSKTTELLEKLLPKEQAETLRMASDGLIGVVVWRRPNVTAISSRLASHRKHGSSKKHLSTRQQQSTKTSLPPTSLGTNTAKIRPHPEDKSDDMPPGFGPGDDDDLPEFDFARGSAEPAKPASSVSLPSVFQPVQPVEQIRQLIHKYGQSKIFKKPRIDVQPWNDDDDIPEWRPQDHHHQAQSPMPPPSLPQPPPQVHTFQQQQFLQAMQMNHQMITLHQQQQQQQLPPHPQVPLQQLMHVATLPTMAQLPPSHIAVMQAPINLAPGWQQSPMLPPLANYLMQIAQHNGQPNVNGQMYSTPNLGAAVQNVLGWRPDVFGSRG